MQASLGSKRIEKDVKETRPGPKDFRGYDETR